MNKKHERAQITGLSVIGVGASRRVDFPDHPIEIRAGDKIAATIPVGAATVVPALPSAVPHGAWWDNITRAWFVDRDGEAVRLHPQPPAPPADVCEVFARLGAPIIEARGVEPCALVGKGAEARPASAVAPAES